MLGFSLSKLIFTAGIIIAVWKGFKMLEAFRNRVEAENAAPPPKAKRQQALNEVEMIECPRCGAFAPKGQFCTCDKTA